MGWLWLKVWERKDCDVLEGEGEKGRCGGNCCGEGFWGDFEVGEGGVGRYEVMVRVRLRMWMMGRRGFWWLGFEERGGGWKGVIRDGGVVGGVISYDF